MMDRDLAPDWILKQALAANSSAHQTWLNSKPELDDNTGLTLTVLGCGTMGTAILGGILESLQGDEQDKAAIEEDQPERLPTKFIACVRTQGSARRVRKALDKYNARLTVLENDNLRGVSSSDIVLLCCESSVVQDVLQADGIQDALAGKTLVSICAGIAEHQIYEMLYGGNKRSSRTCTIIRSVPNIATAVRESMTVISVSNVAVPSDINTLVTWIFSRIGRVTRLPAANMDACTALCGSGPAFVSVMLESLVAGAVAMGLPRDECYKMAAQMMRGTSEMILQGEHPAILKDRVSTPGGCTVAGLAVLEESAVRGAVAKAVREATVVAGQQGAQPSTR